MDILRTERLCKTYGQGENRIHAVDDVSLSVARGEFVVVVGSSGSGKSTLLHILGGVDRPDSGRVIIEEEDIYRLKNDQLAVFRRRQVGLIYQFYNLIPMLDVEENMTLPCELDKRKVDRERVEELAETLGLSRHMHHLPNQLSGGQQQRAAIARSLIYRPALLLADEPTGNLDRKNSREILDLLKLSNRNLEQTMILITHDEKAALEADRIVTIEDGRIIRDEKRW